MIERRIVPTWGRVATVLFALALVAALVPTGAFASPAQDGRDGTVLAQAGNIASGTSGSCSWVIDANGALVIQPSSGGTGALGDFSFEGETGPSSAPWYAYRTQVKSVQVKPGVAGSTSLSGAFAGLKEATSFDLSGLSTSGVRDMSHMFTECAFAPSLDVSGFDTSSVTDMSGMFDACARLASLDVSRFDTSNVTDMSAMFRGGVTLTSLNVSGLDTSKVTNMSDMFANCAALAKLDVSSFDTRNVVKMQRMFSNLALVDLDLSNFETPALVDMWGMFMYEKSLKHVDISGFDTSDVTSMGYLFTDCYALERVRVGSGFAFDDDSSYLPDALWYSSTSGKTYRPAEIASQFKNVAATYVLAKSGSAPAIISGAETTWAKGTETGASFRSNAPLDEFVCAKIDGVVVAPGNYDLVGSDTNVTFKPDYLYDIATGSHSVELLSATGTASTTFTISEDPLLSVPVTMYRVYNPNSGEHHYTADDNERITLIGLGWNDEGIGWIAPKGGHAVYRLYNANAGEHHYTKDATERDALVAAGWTDEGIGWRTAGTVPLYRQYNPNQLANNHNYTTDDNERSTLIGLGWQDEGIGWYGIGTGK